MPAAAWFTLIVAALIIAVTAVGLLRVIGPPQGDPQDRWSPPRGESRPSRSSPAPCRSG